MTEGRLSDGTDRTSGGGLPPESPDAQRHAGGAADPSGAGAAAEGLGGGTGRRTAGWLASRRSPRRALAGGFAAVLAAVLGVMLVWQFSESAACAAGLAAPPSGSTVHMGKASHYDGGSSGGNCSFPGPPANRLYVALGSTQYAGSAACGSFLDVTGPKGKVRVMVLDRCAGCSAGKIDLSRQAFAKIADLSQGIVPVTYRAVVDPPAPGPLTFRIKGGASQYWFAVQVGNHGNPVRSVAARRDGSGWRAAKRGSDNYWVIDGGLGAGPYSIRVVDIYGNQAVATGIRMTPRQLQRSTVRMYDAVPAGGAVPTSPARTSPPPTGPPTAVPTSPDGVAPSGLPVAGAAGSPVRVGCG